MAKRYLQNTAENLPSVTRSRSKISNMLVTGAGQGGAGDRNANVSVPFYSQNPETFTNPLMRWREYCLMWQTSWEVRKIVNIPVDDALRKSFLLKGISEPSSTILQKAFDRLQLVPVLKRSLKLERLLGGCLTFMGLDSTEDNAGIPYKPSEGAKLRFLNSIPISRISRMNWDTNPLHESYMRPDSFFVNNVNVHVSRCLVWDGQPLFDPNDFALTNYRANLAGFGQSVVGALFDDVVMACGTRQAAYQMVQMAGAIIATIDQLQDLAGSAPGQANLAKIEQMVNQLSTFRATLLDGEKVQVQSFAPAFGSIPELLITYLQVLSAASDIPASRFLGQAPGGLSTDDRSGLENYYNNIDAYQTERITPQLMRLCDVVGYAEIGELWKKERDELKIEWPPLWNETAKEQAERASLQIDNVMKLVDAALMGDEAAIEEINAREILSTKLEKDDLELLASAQDAVDRHLGGMDPKTGNPVDKGSDPELHKKPSERESENAQSQIQRLKNMATDPVVHYQKGRDKYNACCNTPMGVRGHQTTTADKAQVTCVKCRKKLHLENSLPDSVLKAYFTEAGGDPEVFDIKELRKGYTVEQEHADVTGGDPTEVMRIVLAHMTEAVDYYTQLEGIEK